MRNWFQRLLNRLISWLFDLLEIERQRRVKVAAELKQAILNEKQIKQSQYVLEEIAKRQESCKHLKGGKLRSPHMDYAVCTHTFVDGTVVVKCMVCGKRWSKANQNLAEGLQLAEQSSNTPTSSERSFGPKKDRVEPYQIKISHSGFTSEIQNGPLTPFASSGWIKYWDKMLKKLTRKKKSTKLDKSK